MSTTSAARTSTHLPPQWQVWAALATIYLVWGSTYLAIRVMVRTVPPLLGAGARFMIAGAVLLAFLAARDGLARVRVSRRELAVAALIGTLLAAGGNGLVTIAEQDVPSGLAALLIATVPLWIVLYRSIARDRVAPNTLISVAIGFVGVAVLLLPGNRPSGVPLGASLVVILAGASWGLGSFAAQRLQLPADGIASTGWQMFWGGSVMTVAGLAIGEAGDLNVSALSAESLWAFAYLVVFGAILAFSAYAWLLRHAPISQVATYAFVNPVVAVVLGALILDESIGAATIAGTALITASVAATVRSESSPAAPKPSTEETDAIAPEPVSNPA